MARACRAALSLRDAFSLGALPLAFAFWLALAVVCSPCGTQVIFSRVSMHWRQHAACDSMHMCQHTCSGALYLRDMAWRARSGALRHVHAAGSEWGHIVALDVEARSRALVR